MRFFPSKLDFMQTGIARAEADGERRPLANSTDLQNRNCGLGILEIDLAMLLEAFFSPKNSKSDCIQNFTELGWQLAFR
jgi:hypothetical protein